jgi:ABC-type phosphate transport system substrate-binding protein
MLSCEISAKFSPEQVAQVIDWKIARDMVCMVVHEGLGIDNITQDEIRDIYEAGAGIATLTWEDVRDTAFEGKAAFTGVTELVVPISRETNSGTRATFMELVPVSDDSATQAQVEASYGILRQSSNGNVATLVNDGAHLTAGRGLIGYVGLGYAYDEINYPNLQVLAVWNGSDWIIPTSESYIEYSLKRYLHMVTLLPRFDPSYKLPVLDYIYFILDQDQGQVIVENNKFIRVVPGADGNPPPYWDLNTTPDGICNILDAVKIGLKWQYHCAYPGEVREDMNGDGIVNILDAVPIGLNWQKTWDW